MPPDTPQTPSHPLQIKHSRAGERRLPPEPPQAQPYREKAQLPQSLTCQLVLQSEGMESFKESSVTTWAAEQADVVWLLTSDELVAASEH